MSNGDRPILKISLYLAEKGCLNSRIPLFYAYYIPLPSGPLELAFADPAREVRRRDSPEERLALIYDIRRID